MEENARLLLIEKAAREYREQYSTGNTRAKLDALSAALWPAPSESSGNALVLAARAPRVGRGGAAALDRGATNDSATSCTISGGPGRAKPQGIQ